MQRPSAAPSERSAQLPELPELPDLHPAQSFDAELLLRAQAVRVLFLDVDGVLTDGGIYIGEQPAAERGAAENLKRFSTLDGHGLKMLQSAGITPVVITGRDSVPLRARLGALGITRAHYGTEAKRAAAEQTLTELGLSWSQAAGMGDDWPDLPVLRRCALACAPAQAHVEVRAIAHHICSAPAGGGAVRELCDLLLTAQGVYAQLLAEAAA